MVGLFIWEDEIWKDEGIWVREVYDQYGYYGYLISRNSMATNQESIFTAEAYYEPMDDEWVSITPNCSFNNTKLDGDELHLE